MGRGCFAWPKNNEAGALQIVAEELTLLLTGIDPDAALVVEGGVKVF